MSELELPAVQFPRELWFRWERRLDARRGWITNSEPHAGETIDGPWREMTPEERELFHQHFGEGALRAETEAR